MPENSCSSIVEASVPATRKLLREGTLTFGTCVALANEVFAQQSGGPPRTPTVQALQTAFTGPVATALALVAIVVGGPMFAFSESATQRTFTGVILAVGMAVSAVNFMAWVFP